MKKWEYKKEYFNEEDYSSTIIDRNCMEDKMNRLGKDGWELIGIKDKWCLFKREYA